MTVVTPGLHVIVDENIALPANLPAQLRVTLMPGREIEPRHVANADALLVRSVTRVNEALLQGSTVKFVGTATSGTDHLDLQWLSAQGIEVVDAAGANADAVTDYVLSCLSSLVDEGQVSLDKVTVAVVGVGRVGSRLVTRLTALGINCVGCDPLQQTVAGLQYVPLDDALKADIVCLHTPLTTSGEYPTWHMLDDAALARLARNTVLLNAGRGEVICSQALKRHLTDFPQRRIILDVWEGEPQPDPQLVRLAYIATPHIAGYSLESKQLAGVQVLAALCQHFGLDVPDVLSNKRKAGDVISMPVTDHSGTATHSGVSAGTKTDINALDVDNQRDLARHILRCFSASELSTRFRRDYLATSTQRDAAVVFDRYRRGQLTRREFSSCTVVRAEVRPTQETPGARGQDNGRQSSSLVATSDTLFSMLRAVGFAAGE